MQHLNTAISTVIGKTSFLRTLGVIAATSLAGIAFGAKQDGDAGVAAATDFTKREVAEIWRDPTFQKQFVGGYGVNAEIEPRVTKEEVALLEKVRPLMADSLPKAEEAMRAGMKPNCSAILDFTLGGMLFQQDKLVDALVSYRKAVEKFPTFRRAFRNIGLISVRNSDF